MNETQLKLGYRRSWTNKSQTPVYISLYFNRFNIRKGPQFSWNQTDKENGLLSRQNSWAEKIYKNVHDNWQKPKDIWKQKDFVYKLDFIQIQILNCKTSHKNDVITTIFQLLKWNI